MLLFIQLKATLYVPTNQKCSKLYFLSKQQVNSRHWSIRP